MNTQVQAIDMTLPVGSLDAYILRANQIPMLTLEQEREYTQKFYDDGDLTAARQLILAHLRYVIKVARGYMGYGLPLADLIQEGNVGLMKAVKRFDPAYKVRLVSFAVHWIKSEIHEYVIRNWRVVKIATTKAQRKLFFNLRSLKSSMQKRLGWMTKAEINDVANDLGVPTKEVEAMELRLNSMDAAFDGPDSDDDKAYLAPSRTLEDHSADPAILIEAANTSENGLENLSTAMAILDERSQDILQQRWLAEKKATLHELAAKYSVSAERIRQLEQQAMQRMKAAIESKRDAA